MYQGRTGAQGLTTSLALLRPWIQSPGSRKGPVVLTAAMQPSDAAPKGTGLGTAHEARQRNWVNTLELRVLTKLLAAV